MILSSTKCNIDGKLKCPAAIVIGRQWMHLQRFWEWHTRVCGSKMEESRLGNSHQDTTATLSLSVLASASLKVSDYFVSVLPHCKSHCPSPKSSLDPGQAISWIRCKSNFELLEFISVLMPYSIQLILTQSEQLFKGHSKDKLKYISTNPSALNILVHRLAVL